MFLKWLCNHVLLINTLHVEEKKSEQKTFHFFLYKKAKGGLRGFQFHTCHSMVEKSQGKEVTVDGVVFIVEQDTLQLLILGWPVRQEVRDVPSMVVK